MNKLEKSIKALGWQGGTVHQVNAIFSHATKTIVDINNMSDNEFNLMLYQYEEAKQDLIKAHEERLEQLLKMRGLK